MFVKDTRNPKRMSMRVCERYEKSRTLPLGHYEKRRAKEALEEEYGDCKEVEREYPEYYLYKEECLGFLWKICDAIGEKPPRIVVNSREVSPGAGACYNSWKKEIHIPYYFPVSFRTIVHELTHHCGPLGHGKDFCDLEEFLFEVAGTVRRNRD